MAAAKKIFILYTDAGGGHLATARALAAGLERETPHEVSLINPYRELIANIDLFPRLTGYTDEEVYNRFVLGRGWPGPLCLAYYALTLLNVRLGSKRAARRFLAHWQQEKPDLVISVMPLANQGIYRSVRAYAGQSSVPLLVVMTDLREEVRGVWFPKERDYYLACATEPAHGRALAKPHPPDLAFRLSGLPVHPAFYDRPSIDRTAERVRLGLRPDWPTGCMMYGGNGSPRMALLAGELAKVDRDCQMIFLCGRNQALAQDLERLNLPYPHLIQTYTTRVPYYFALADFLVCKPGPGTISEAGVAGLSLLVDRQNVLPQERHNLDWIRENRLGRSFKSPAQFGRAVRDLLTEAREKGGFARPAQPDNRAVFELTGIIQTILNRQNSR